jgi:hypothetical protein
MIFQGFYTIFYFRELSRTQYFNFLNLVLTKNLQIHYSFFIEFLFQNFSIFKNFKLNRPVFSGPTKLVRIDFISFHKNQLIFGDIVIHGGRKLNRELLQKKGLLIQL